MPRNRRDQDIGNLGSHTFGIMSGRGTLLPQYRSPNIAEQDVLYGYDNCKLSKLYYIPLLSYSKTHRLQKHKIIPRHTIYIFIECIFPKSTSYTSYEVIPASSNTMPHTKQKIFQHQAKVSSISFYNGANLTLRFNPYSSDT